MIESCGDEETEKIFKGRVSRKLPLTIQKTARRKLLYLEEAEDLHDLRSPPGNRLELLRGDRAGQYSMRINEQWRLCFYWEAGKAKQVKIEDYHD
ncbi:MAG: type II toxin-antitoxin system RelE/ParE family toxin [Caldilinea sp.]|nr:type II toxin-antitoxin system RelE/ParE family toxin [Caldilinea sp.]